MAETEPGLWTKAMTGQSREGRQIEFYTTGSTAPGSLDTLIFGAFHGDERESELVTRALLASPELKDVAAKRLGLVPITNPDGFAKNQRVNAHGVDLNRNFPTGNWAEEGLDSIYYSGPIAGSEPETQFILTVLAQYPPQKIITIHTPYKVINFDGPGRELAETMARHNGYPVVEDIGYATPGSFGTYVGKERNIPTLTLELPEDNFDDTELRNNLSGILAVIQHH